VNSFWDDFDSGPKSAKKTSMRLHFRVWPCQVLLLNVLTVVFLCFYVLAVAVFLVLYYKNLNKLLSPFWFVAVLTIDRIYAKSERDVNSPNSPMPATSPTMLA